FSAYSFLKKGGIMQRDKLFAEKHILPYNSFKEFILNELNKKNVKRDFLFVPQYKFVCDHHGNLITDYIGKFERLDEEFSYIAHRMGQTNTLELKKLNVSTSNLDYRENYTKEMADIISSVYKKDIEMFN